MNAFNLQIMESDGNGLTESCDCCQALIHNWDWMKMSYVSHDGKRILCLLCWNDERKEILTQAIDFASKR